MGLEATWSLVDIPADARDAAQAAARREGVPVGEWLTRRILRRFSEVNAREQAESFVALRNHVSDLAHRVDRFEGQGHAEPMREALKKLHEAMTRLNEELLRTAGHSAIQISNLSSSLETLNSRLNEQRDDDAESRGAFERRMTQLQELVDGMNMRHAAETRAVAARVDTLGGTLAESRRLIANEKSAVERLEDSLNKADLRYNTAFRALHEKFDSLSGKISESSAAASELSATVGQRIGSLQAELGNIDARNGEERQLTASRIEKLHGKVDDLQADVTGMCSALDRRVLLAQQALQSLDSRHTEISHSMTRNVELVTQQLDAVRADSMQASANLEWRLANLENARNTSSGEAAIENRFTQIEQHLSDLNARTNVAVSQTSALLPRTEAIEAHFEQLNLSLEREAEKQHQAIEQMKAGLLEQTLTTLGEKLETESKKQQAAVAELRNGLLDQLSRALNERTEAEERHHREAMVQLQSTFATALQTLGATFEVEARKQQDAIAELKASLAVVRQPPTVQSSTEMRGAAESTSRQPAEAYPSLTATDPNSGANAPLYADSAAVFMHDSETYADLPAVLKDQHEGTVLELTTLAGDEQTGASQEPASFEAPSPASHDSLHEAALQSASLDGIRGFATSAMSARDNVQEDGPSPSYLSAARQSLQSAVAGSDSETQQADAFALRLLKSLPLAGKKTGQGTSYALVAGIALVAILALVVGAVELMNRSTAPTAMPLLPAAHHVPTTQGGVTAAKGAVTKTAASSPRLTATADRVASLAAGGNAQAELLVGLRELAKNNDAEAARWLERAANQGIPLAEYRLATLYASGHGVTADTNKSFRWYLAAAQAGNRKAMSNLAVAYAQGEGTPKNPEEAGRWFLKAAQLGLPDAQFDLAILYERGLGVPQNLTDAYRWYVIAAKAGDKESKDRADALSSQLKAEDRAAAETAAAEFKPQPIDPRANEP